MRKKILEEIIKMRSIAEVGLLYCNNPYDRERYENLYEVSIQLMSELSQSDTGLLKTYFPLSKDYPTAKVDIRTMVLSPGKEILLVKEQADQKWSLPGGWADIGYSPSEIAAKECREESGLDVTIIRLLAVFDKRKHDHPPHADYVYKMVFYGEAVSGQLMPGFDVMDVKYFNINALPELSEDRILKNQLQLAYNKIMDPDHSTYFD